MDIRRNILDGVLARLWDRYLEQVSHADRYRALVEAHGGRAVNDHIAFRSINADLAMQPPGIAAVRELLLALGYETKDHYVFEETHLQAVHLEHPDGDLPKIFISQLEMSELPDAAAEKIRSAIAQLNADYAYPADLIAALQRGEVAADQVDSAVERIAAMFTRPWAPPRRSTVVEINGVSQYAAWTLLHGNAVNHFTAFINEQQVDDWPDIEATVQGLRDAGVPMKDAIEGAPGSKLRQSATRAVSGSFPVTEDDGRIGAIDWTYAYYELAERGMVVGEDGRMRQFSGFLGAQTPGLFEMTRVG